MNNGTNESLELPAPGVGATLRNVIATERSRRDFLRAAGLGGVALALAACTDGAGLDLLAPSAARSAAAGGGIVLDFSSDLGVLNYAYALEQLEAAFYSMVVANSAFTSVFSAGEQIVLRDVRDHEVAHRQFLSAALGANAIGAVTPDFSTINFGNRMSVLTTARTFEDLGVSAYNGAAKYLVSPTYLTVAGKIVSVEARHASAIRSLIAPRTGAFAPNSFDPATSPTDVLAAAGPFITTPISVINS